MLPKLRCTLVIAIGDLMQRWPNCLEPWTAQMYSPLSDPDVRVRDCTLMSLSHLILNEMMKVKGNISKVAKCLLDPDPQVCTCRARGLPGNVFQATSVSARQRLEGRLGAGRAPLFAGSGASQGAV